LPVVVVVVEAPVAVQSLTQVLRLMEEIVILRVPVQLIKVESMVLVVMVLVVMVVLVEGLIPMVPRVMEMLVKPL
jgi:hypothetical protein